MSVVLLVAPFAATMAVKVRLALRLRGAARVPELALSWMDEKLGVVRDSDARFSALREGSRHSNRLALMYLARTRGTECKGVAFRGPV